MKEPSLERKPIEDKELAHDMANPSDAHRTAEALNRKKASEKRLADPGPFLKKVFHLLGARGLLGARAALRKTYERAADLAASDAERKEDEIEIKATVTKETEGMNLEQINELIHRALDDLKTGDSNNLRPWFRLGRLLEVARAHMGKPPITEDADFQRQLNELLEKFWGKSHGKV